MNKISNITLKRDIYRYKHSVEKNTHVPFFLSFFPWLTVSEPGLSFTTAKQNSATTTAADPK